MRYRVIQEHDRRYPIRLMCRASQSQQRAIMRGDHARKVPGLSRRVRSSRPFG